MAGSETRRRRGEARERRRSLLTRPFEELEEKATDAAEAVRDRAPSPLVKTAAAALAAAAAGGLAGAAKAVLERRGDDEQESRDEPSGETEGEEPRAEHEDAAEEPEAESAEREHPEAEHDEEEQPEAESDGEPEAEADEEREAEDEPEAEADEEPEAEEEPGAATGEEPEDERAEPRADAEGEEREQEGADEDGDGRLEGASQSEVAEIVKAALKGMERVLGHEVESVSGFERSDEGWRVTVEVVDMRRIPDSTDVLSSYCVLLDDDRKFVRLDRVRRYRRCQVDDE